MSIKIGIILGSTRKSSNTKGISKYFESILKTNEEFKNIKIEIIHLTESFGHPLPFELENEIPQSKSNLKENLPNEYSNLLIKNWSKTISNWNGLIIITPQYNWGYPALLKNSFDHLYYEWNNLPFGLITIGGHGGSKVFKQLSEILEGGLKMKLINKDNNLQINLPKKYIISSEEDRVKGDENWLKDYKQDFEELIQDLLQTIKERRNEENVEL
ncbi:uncharacterized protein I206_106230 [Kwoniella pini CBS 10737]|uniref:NADPH-dependent FMN reductase-like domain-containing protein n=1 Tax=Kwoniella pini CBS 10737 TaxID=1296096 RepID=A0A1B9I1F1_9TREE|nr:uncharacterized protein I206_05056 [Kwoniella pini CBS 10737]OCF49363.1 hypothetical protein I206_05056 [Kwoniella pini CBS 10737]